MCKRVLAGEAGTLSSFYPSQDPFLKPGCRLAIQEGHPLGLLAVAFPKLYMETIKERDPGDRSPNGKASAFMANAPSLSTETDCEFKSQENAAPGVRRGNVG